MAVHCGTHGVQHSTRVCRHISLGIRTGRKIKTGYKVSLDTDNIRRFMDEALVCQACRNKMINKSCVTRFVLKEPWIVTIEDMIGEGGYVPHFDSVCNKCLEGITIASRFLPSEDMTARRRIAGGASDPRLSTRWRHKRLREFLKNRT